jgi:hypothetical protein
MWGWWAVWCVKRKTDILWKRHQGHNDKNG